MIGQVLFNIWFIGFIGALIYGHYCLIVDSRKGLIQKPYSPLGWVSMVFNCAIWFIFLPYIIGGIIDGLSAIIRAIRQKK